MQPRLILTASHTVSVVFVKHRVVGVKHGLVCLTVGAINHIVMGVTQRSGCAHGSHLAGLKRDAKADEFRAILIVQIISHK